jgi:hypothetical protein
MAFKLYPFLRAAVVSWAGARWYTSYYMKSLSEADLQGRFGKWLRYGGGASYRSNGGCLYHKLNDSALGFVPFDCFVLGIKEGSFLGEMGLVACGFELKMGREGGTVPYSEVKESQLDSLRKCKAGGVEGRSDGFLVMGFQEDIGVSGDGLRQFGGLEVYMLDIEVVEGEMLREDGSRKRGSFSVMDCRELEGEGGVWRLDGVGRACGCEGKKNPRG